MSGVCATTWPRWPRWGAPLIQWALCSPAFDTDQKCMPVPCTPPDPTPIPCEPAPVAVEAP